MAAFPTSVATDSDLYVAVNATSTQLTDNPLTSGATTVNVVSTTGFPAVGFISIENEIILYTGVTATSFTGCSRGADGTSATSHVQNSQVFHNVIAAHHNVLKNEVIAVETFLDTHIGKSTAVTAAEFERLSGVTSPIQTQLGTKIDTAGTGLSKTGTTLNLVTPVTIANGGTNSSTALSNNRVIRSTSGSIVEAAAITAARALISDANGIPTHSSVTDTELGYVSGVTSAIQTQLNNLPQADGWTPANETWTYASATTFTVTGDVTAKYQKGDKIKLTQTTAKYFYIVSVSFSGSTTITITGGTDYTLANAAITSPFYSKTNFPQGFPARHNYTPTYTGSASMTYTSVTTTIAAFNVVNGVVHVWHESTGTISNADVTVSFTVPITTAVTQGSKVFFATADTNGVGKASVGTTTASVLKDSEGNWTNGSGRRLATYVSYAF